MRTLSNQDSLTLLYNRASLMRQLDGFFSRAGRYGETLTIGMIDLDGFKKFNDTHGHPAGDDVLKRLAFILVENVREVDTVARYGGEEFVAVISHADEFGLSILSERLRIAVEDMKIETECQDCLYCHDGHHPVTISVGFTIQHETDESGWDVVERADAALMVAKRLGRNRVESDILGNEEVLLVNKIEDARCK